MLGPTGSWYQQILGLIGECIGAFIEYSGEYMQHYLWLYKIVE